MYRALEDELLRAFHFFNDRYAEGKLPTPVITIAPGKRDGTLGYFLKEGFEMEYDGKDEDGNPNIHKEHHINLSAEYIRERGVIGALETLAHEMAHLANAHNDIKDVTGHQYHNTKFKEMAEKFDLIVHKHGSRGYAYTSEEISDKFKEAVEEFNTDESIWKIARVVNKRKHVSKYISVIVTKNDYFEDLLSKLEEHYGSKREAVETALQRLAEQEGLDDD